MNIVDTVARQVPLGAMCRYITLLWLTLTTVIVDTLHGESTPLTQYTFRTKNTQIIRRECYQMRDSDAARERVAMGQKLVLILRLKISHMSRL